MKVLVLYELKYEVTRGIVQCTFNTKPTFYNTSLYYEPKLRIVGDALEDVVPVTAVLR